MTVPGELYERVALLEAQIKYLAERSGVHLPDFLAVAQSGLTAEVQQLIANGDKLGAIKRYRELTGCDLATAKQVVESY